MIEALPFGRPQAPHMNEWTVHAYEVPRLVKGFLFMEIKG